MKLTRRQFIKMSASAAIAAAGTLSFGGLFVSGGPGALDAFASYSGPGASGAGGPGAFPDIVAARGKAPAKMFEAAIEAFGGMQRFVKKGAVVLVKPNIGWARTPAEAANTDPGLVAAMVDACIRAGARRVYVLDNSCDHWRSCYEKSGIAAAARAAGATVMPAFDPAHYRPVAVTHAKKLGSVLVHKIFLDADCVINAPVLKHHGSTAMSCALKNLMGVAFDRRPFHLHGLSDSIAGFAAVRRPDLTVVDAGRVISAHGPRGLSADDILSPGMLLLGTDMVALDSAAARILGVDPRTVAHLAAAEKLGLGTGNVEKLSVSRLTL